MVYLPMAFGLDCLMPGQGRRLCPTSARSLGSLRCRGAVVCGRGGVAQHQIYHRNHAPKTSQRNKQSKLGQTLKHQNLSLQPNLQLGRFQEKSPRMLPRYGSLVRRLKVWCTTWVDRMVCLNGNELIWWDLSLADIFFSDGCKAFQSFLCAFFIHQTLLTPSQRGSSQRIGKFVAQEAGHEGPATAASGLQQFGEVGLGSVFSFGRWLWPFKTYELGCKLVISLWKDPTLRA